MAQPLKKKEVKNKPTIASFKEKLGLTTMKSSNADKPMEWLLMPKGFVDAVHLPGLPISYCQLVCGFSDSGKSTIINHAIASAQRQGYIPVLFDTENNFDFKYAIDMGMEAEPVYEDVEVETVDVNTGEVTVSVEKRITSYDGNFLYFNNANLAERYGCNDYSKGTKNGSRTVAVLEDIAYCINELLDAQDNGDIEAGFVFIWDSVGSIGSWKSYTSKTGNNMFDAASISAAFNTIVNDRIPRSRKVSSKFSNTFICVNKVWLDSMSNPMPGAPPSLALKGGNSLFYSARLILLCGGKLKAGAKKLTATSKGLTYTYAMQTKLGVLKNQLPSPWSVTYSGEIVCTPTGIISADKETIEEYKKTHVGDILKQLSEMADNTIINSDEITFSETDENSDF